MFKKRIGLDPHRKEVAGGGSTSLNGCPDIWELEDGNIAIIGQRKTAVLKPYLPDSAGCSIDEEIVVIPRKTLICAQKDVANLK
jgi:hypothetical protein